MCQEYNSPWVFLFRSSLSTAVTSLKAVKEAGERKEKSDLLDRSRAKTPDPKDTASSVSKEQLRRSRA